MFLNMKKLILLILFISVLVQVHAQSYFQEIQEFQSELNAEYANPETSPLEAQDMESFEGLPYFEADSIYRVVASLDFNVDKSYMKVPTYAGKIKIYQRYAAATFMLNGQKHTLYLYQNEQLKEIEEYKDYLFLPFKDKTNGEESYGGGRYLDLKIPEGNTIIIDFNKAYNPYCAYSDRYNCPVPPAENKLSVAIKAGVKAPVYKH